MNLILDLAGCRVALVPHTRIALVIPGPEAERRLSARLGIPGRFKAIRAEALRNLALGAEAFAQRNYGLGGHFYLSVSLLTDRENWRGGWLLFHAPSGWEERLVKYIEAARDEVVTDLRKERAQRGSKN